MEVPTAQKSDREVAYGGLFIFGKKTPFFILTGKCYDKTLG